MVENTFGDQRVSKKNEICSNRPHNNCNKVASYYYLPSIFPRIRLTAAAHPSLSRVKITMTRELLCVSGE